MEMLLLAQVINGMISKMRQAFIFANLHTASLGCSQFKVRNETEYRYIYHIYSP